MEQNKNRWLIAASAVGIHISIGSVYAWSVFTTPLVQEMGWSLKETQFSFSLAIFVLGIAAAFLGHFLEKKGPRLSGMLSALFFGIGIAGSGLAVQLESVYLLYLFYGLLGGIGLGLGYITPIATLIKWFPDKPGLATGMAVMGFGFAALISSPLIVYSINTFGLAPTFYIMGSIYFLAILASSSYLSLPSEGWEPKRPKDPDPAAGKDHSVRDVQLTAEAAVKTRSFWLLWLMFFINISCGIAIISAAAPMAQEFAGLTMVAAATMVGIMGLFNGFGRIGWASLSDRIGRPNMFSGFFLLQIPVFLVLPSVENELLFQILIFIIISCYGGGFATMPSFLKDLFGTRALGVILGYMLTSWAAAGMVGPLFAAWMRTAFNGYTAMLYSFAGLLVTAFLLSLIIRFEMKSSRQRTGISV
ncbi:L-lactate MFS transporter [Salinimicrobium oceani]|uniref:OFA family MFS transporter n=1 Tax=Salinimicrobium oceani TaxID=2722702 RepID=A0ABX1CZ77_9FLAO|nr:OFA family MFS transporter [Salinimicrobium oceani]NJW53077.1 OFA family MFS transporter [Salinimicrobium oceani]